MTIENLITKLEGKYPYRTFKDNDILIINGECLEVMNLMIEANIICDTTITDIPYGTTSCKWDKIIPFEFMWKRLDKLIKPNGAVVLFGSEPFSSHLRMSNIKNYKYDWIWEKERGTNFPSVNFQPFRVHEMISIFGEFTTTYRKNGIYNYNPQFSFSTPYKIKASMGIKVKPGGFIRAGSSCSKNNIGIDNPDGKRYPKSIIKINREATDKIHPTQKPVPLIQYLIKTYTNENELVLDFTAGSLTTAVACIKEKRKCICIELDEEYYNLGINRIETKLQQGVLDL